MQIIKIECLGCTTIPVDLAWYRQVFYSLLQKVSSTFPPHLNYVRKTILHSPPEKIEQLCDQELSRSDVHDIQRLDVVGCHYRVSLFAEETTSPILVAYVILKVISGSWIL